MPSREESHDSWVDMPILNMHVAAKALSGNSTTGFYSSHQFPSWIFSFLDIFGVYNGVFYPYSQTHFYHRFPSY